MKLEIGDRVTLDAVVVRTETYMDEQLVHIGIPFYGEIVVFQESVTKVEGGDEPTGD